MLNLIINFENSSTVLSGFSSLNTFATLIKQVSNIASSSCCVFSPQAWSLFTTYALDKLVRNNYHV